ncbi:MAG: class I SAM-dependent methyltransferase [Pirellulaceae bacterium]|nr:class I SAM-dependent methyltransferase [Pirellulaceae bacterium]
MKRSLSGSLLALLLGPASERRLVRYWLGERAAAWIGNCWVAEDLKAWQGDREFLEAYRRFEPRNMRSAERKFTVRELVRSLADVPGDTAECGVYRGATSYFICRERPHGTHHLFDSFQGLSPPLACDLPDQPRVDSWRAGDLAIPLDEVRANLAEFPGVRFHPGWIPDRFPEVADRRFCFVHIDVDLYQPTLDSLRFFYERSVPRGILVCDDYGYLNCPGAKRACDEFARSIAEPLIHLPTGQAVIFKR